MSIVQLLSPIWSIYVLRIWQLRYTFICHLQRKWSPMANKGDARGDGIYVNKPSHDLINLSPGHKTTRNKWVLKIKLKADGSIGRYNTWLITKHYNEVEGIEYGKLFSLVVRFTSLLAILTVDLELDQVDVRVHFSIEVETKRSSMIKSRAFYLKVKKIKSIV